jgi:hypothetical protein
MSDTDTTAKVEATPAATPVAPKKSNTGLIIILVIILVLCLCCSAIGGGLYFVSRNAESLAKAAIDEAQKKARDQVNNVNGNNSGTDNGTSNSTGTDSGSASLDNKLPAGFPSDVPIYPNAKVGLSSSSKKDGKDEYFATLTVKGTTSDVVSYYKNNLPKNGWNITGEYNFFGSSLVAEKNGREATVVILGDDKEADQTITLSVTYKN